MPVWERVGHSVLFGFFLWGCGEHILLHRLQAETAALLVLDPEAADIAWNAAGSISQQLALVRLLGGSFPQSVDVDDLLRLKEVTDTVRSMDGNREVIPYGDSLHVMQRLAGLQILGGRSYGTKIGADMSDRAHISAAQQLLDRRKDR